MSDEATAEELLEQENNEFEAAFAEHAEAKEAPLDTDDDDGLEGAGEPESQAEAVQSSEAGAGGATDDGGGAATDEAATAQPDPYEGMSDEVKAQFMAIEEERNDWKHKYESDAGRVSAFQRQVNDLNKKIEKINASSNRPQPTKAEISDAMKGTDEDWKKFQEDYPEVAGAIDKRLDKAFGAQAEVIETTLAPVVEKQAKDHMEEAYDAVAETYPTWQDAVKTTEFSEWIGTQPPGIQALADSDDVTDASSLIGMYDEHRVSQGQPSLKADPGSDKGGVDDGSETVDEVEKRRKRQLKDGVTIPSKSAGVSVDTDIVDDFERSFDFYAKKKEAQRQRA